MRFRARHFAAALAGVLALATGPSGGALAQDEQLVDGPGKATLMEACTQCHGEGQIIAQHRAPEDWSEVMSRMVGFGASISDNQQAEILAYLNTNYGKGDTAAAAAAAAAPTPAPADAAAASSPH